MEVSYLLIDSHCHILSSEFKNPKEIIENSKLCGVDKMIINGFDLESSREAITLANNYDYVYASIGIGPENIDNICENDFLEFEKLINKGKIVAIGEIGLDYYWTKENKQEQIEIFKKQLMIAESLHLPVIVHSRESILDTYNLLNEYNVTGILHCYSGSLEMANRFIKKGFLIGIGGVVTFKNAKKVKEVVKEIPITSISLETDSPYLTPEPYRGKPNNPLYLKYIIKEISDLKGISKDEVKNVTSQNVMSKFDL